jgi:hypothetical protein
MNGTNHATPPGADESVRAAALFADGLSEAYDAAEFERKLRIWFGLILGKFTALNVGMDQIAAAISETARQQGWLRVLIERARGDRARNADFLRICTQSLEILAVAESERNRAVSKPHMDPEVRSVVILNYTLLIGSCAVVALWTYTLWGWTVSSVIAGFTAVAALVKALGPLLPERIGARIALWGAKYLVQRRTAQFVGIFLAVVVLASGFIGTVEIPQLPAGVSEIELSSLLRPTRYSSPAIVPYVTAPGCPRLITGRAPGYIPVEIRVCPWRRAQLPDMNGTPFLSIEVDDSLKHLMAPEDEQIADPKTRWTIECHGTWTCVASCDHFDGRKPFLLGRDGNYQPPGEFMLPDNNCGTPLHPDDTVRIVLHKPLNQCAEWQVKIETAADKGATQRLILRNDKEFKPCQ